MRRRKSDWFTIVASDFFSNCFAAILIIDAVSPKISTDPGSEYYFELSYLPASGQQCAGRDAFVLLFKDDDGKLQSSLSSRPEAKHDGARCVLSGTLIDVALSNEPTAVEVLIGDIDVDPADISLTIGTLSRPTMHCEAGTCK